MYSTTKQALVMITAALQNAIIYFRNFWLSFFFQRFCTIHSILNSLPIPHYFSFSLSPSLSFSHSHSLFSIKPSFCCAHTLFHSLSYSPILYFMTLSSVHNEHWGLLRTILFRIFALYVSVIQNIASTKNWLYHCNVTWLVK